VEAAGQVMSTDILDNLECDPHMEAAPQATSLQVVAGAPPVPVFDLPHDFDATTFDDMLAWAVTVGASDLKLQSGDYVCAHIYGRWTPITKRRLENAEIEFILNTKYGPTAVSRLDQGEYLDFRLSAVKSLDNVLGFRANATRSRVGALGRGISITARAIPGLPPKWDSLSIEPELDEAFFPEYGLILVVGVTGSGKSTLMASSVRQRLEGPVPVSVGTYEDPVEFTFGDLGMGRMPLVSQVEIGQGSDLRAFDRAGPNAMRRKFDVIIAGELRDRQSIDAGLELASTGHAVLATLHVETPAQAVDRIVSFFPYDAQPAVASKLRSVLRVVVAQKLARTLQGKRAAIRSWLVFDREVKDKMGAAQYHEWPRLLSGMVRDRGAAFEQRAVGLLREGAIDLATFCAVAEMTPSEARAYMEGQEQASQSPREAPACVRGPAQALESTHG
jgi:defect-in-organelle-trafficking protein DotB